MQLKQIEAIKSIINVKIETGDFTILSKVLGVNREAATMRYKRNKPNEVRLMKAIVNNREKLIAKLKTDINGKI